MEYSNVQIVPIEQDSNEKSSVNFSAILNKCLGNWHWFVISVAFCLAVAGFYILKTPPTYNRTATLLIKESATRRMTSSDLESMLAGSSGQVSSKVVNEVIAFQSPALMLEVVNRLKLSTFYSRNGFFRSSVLYGAQVPVEVEFLDVPSSYLTKFSIYKSDQGCVISNFEYHCQGDKFKGFDDIVVSYGDTVSTPAGHVIITPNAYFDGEWKKPLEVLKVDEISAANGFLAGFKATSVDVKNKSDVIELSLTDLSVQRADDILNMMITVYNENWVSDKNKMAVSTSSFINERLKALEKELRVIDENVSSFKSSNLIPDVNAASSMYVEQTKDNMRYIQEIENQLYIYRYIRAYLNNNPESERLIPMAGSIGNNAISTQLMEYNRMLLNRNSIKSNSSDKNPLVVDLDNALKATRSAIETTIVNQIGTLEEQLDNLKRQEDKTNSKIAASPTQMQYLVSVGRQQKVKESLYIYLLQKREENELSQAFTAYNTRLITPPMGISKPVSPKKKKILLIAIFLGLMIPFIYFNISVLVDTKIRTKKDLQDISIPFLGEIPQYYPANIKWWNKFFAKSPEISHVLVKSGERDVINEAFRVLRTNVEFICRGVKCPVLLLTSYNPGSGKTFLSINMSLALAISGKKVLAIDADMRHASLSEYVKSTKDKGLSNYLGSGLADWHDAVVPFPDNKNLGVIPVGALPPNPSELIAEVRFSDMLEAAKKEYDFIILDCPPVDIVADTQVIHELADRCIFVARAGVMDRSLISSLKVLDTEKNMKNLSIILNGVDAENLHYGKYGYNYRYAYSKKS